MITQTKFKMGLLALALYFIEGILKTIFPGYPLTETIAAQGAIAIGYMGIQLARDKFENNK